MSETPGSEARPYTETSALGEILKWSRQRPAWLRDALRRLMVGGELSHQDIDELEAICLGDDGEGSPLSDEHIAPRRLVGKPVSITGLRDLVGVNALASGQGLTFAAGGLSIVYGDNGSGKSGFVRVKGGEKPDQRAEQNTATAAVGVRWSEGVGIRLGAAGAGNAGRA